MGTRNFGSGNDNFKAYKEGGFLGIGSEWRPWTINGNAGNDTLVGGELSDTISGGADNDVIKGLRGADSINGGAGNDTLYGYDAGRWEAARDILIGGSGNDTYHADTSDIVTESATGGTDTLYLTRDNSSNPRDYFIPINVETVYLEGYHYDRIFGNDLNNSIIVNGFSNQAVDAGGGQDYLKAGASGSIMRGGADDDILEGGNGRDNLSGDGGSDALNGVGFRSTTNGVGTVDILTGGAGSDHFWLGNGLHVYYSDNNAHTSGTNDYAVITDFQSGVDKLNITGPSFAYITRQEFSLGIGSSDVKDTLIFRDSGTQTPELIAILQDTTTLVQSDFISLQA